MQSVSNTTAPLSPLSQFEGSVPLAPHALLAAIVASSDQAILSRDMDGAITTWNRAATRLFGYEPEEIIGQPLTVLIPDELKGEEAAILARLQNGESIDHHETLRRTKSGELIEVSLALSTIEGANGEIIGASAIARDISERKDLDRLKMQTEKILATGRMAAKVAHEINNPLESVVSLIYLARLDGSISAAAREHLKLAEREVERVALISRQTMGFFRELAPEKANPSNIISDVLTVYDAKLLRQGITVRKAFHAVSPVVVRAAELTQVFANLISNAIDAMPDGGELSVTVAPEAGPPETGLRIEFRDTGAGVQATLLGKIFEPFFTTKQQTGAGIGLWLSRQLIEGHRGTITVFSSTAIPGNGTTFGIFLPLDTGLKHAPAFAEIPHANEPRKTTGRVSVQDDKAAR